MLTVRCVDDVLAFPRLEIDLLDGAVTVRDENGRSLPSWRDAGGLHDTALSQDVELEVTRRVPLLGNRDEVPIAHDEERASVARGEREAHGTGYVDLESLDLRQVGHRSATSSVKHDDLVRATAPNRRVREEREELLIDRDREELRIARIEEAFERAEVYGVEEVELRRRESDDGASIVEHDEPLHASCEGALDLKRPSRGLPCPRQARAGIDREVVDLAVDRAVDVVARDGHARDGAGRRGVEERSRLAELVENENTTVESRHPQPVEEGRSAAGRSALSLPKTSGPTRC